VRERTPPTKTDVPPVDPALVLAAADRAVAMAGQCREGSDRLLAALDELARWVTEARAAGRRGDEDAVLTLLGQAGPSAKNTGQKGNWPDIESVRAAFRDAATRRESLYGTIKQACLERVAEEIAGFSVDSAKERREEGRLVFHDLLVLARALMRDPERGLSVRRRLHRRYRRLLLDEFQDTDPIQVELAVLIASPDPGAEGKPWQEVRTERGHLFFVGDPKQSIYRFRRADIGMFLDARRALAGQVEELTTNFRSVAPVVEWVNHTFGQLIIPVDRAQPAYISLAAWRGAVGARPGVAMIGLESHPSNWKAEALREAEAESVAATAALAVAEGWTVGD
ncbi:MAG: UvrD-helicase domain-containing protein, partial [Candidatus Dormibacteria bacterium]